MNRAEVNVIVVCTQKGQVAYHHFPQSRRSEFWSAFFFGAFLLLKGITSRQGVQISVPQEGSSQSVLVECFPLLQLIAVD